jgi:putative tryptophan/tyrosine transport system substrate-binding protein
MRRREFIKFLGGAVAVWPVAARAQQGGKKKYVVGRFTAGSATDPNTEVLTEALRELGWVEGENVVYERRYAENRVELLPEMAADLVRLKVDVIVAGGILAPLAAKRATSTIPIVMASAGDPLGTGLVASLARPGGNVTGMSMMLPDLAGKRLELLRDILPGLARIAVLWESGNPGQTIIFKETEVAARTLGVEVQSLEVRGPDDLARAFEAAQQQHPDALVTVDGPLTLNHAKQIVDFTAGQRLPSVHGTREFAAAGGLVSYGTNLADVLRRAAGYVDKISQRRKAR